MRAVVYAGEGRVEVGDVPRPALEGVGDALVEVHLAAICGSDLHLLHGKTPGVRTGGIIGHEFVGEVVDAADETLVGRRVLGSFLIACGRCEACTGRRFNHCRHRRALGLGTLAGDLDGAQAEFVRVPDASVNLLPLAGSFAHLPDEAALFGGDILATAFYAASLAETGPDDIVVVFGAGPVGLLTAATVRSVGPARVIVADTNRDRTEWARTHLGVEVLDVSARPAEQAIAELTSDRLADVAVDAVGAIPVVKSAMKSVRGGGRVVVLGVYGAERLELSMGMAWVRALDLRFAGMANVQAHWREALAAVSDDRIDPTRLITHRLPLDDAAEGYELFESRRALKVVLRP